MELITDVACVLVLALVGLAGYVGWQMGREHERFEQKMREIPQRMSGEQVGK